MTRPDDLRLDDIMGMVAEIAGIVERGRAEFDGDIALRRALERCLEIIGEAAKLLSSDIRQSIADVDWSEMIRLRDRLSHHYHRVGPALLWVAAERDVPKVGTAITSWRERRGPA